MDVLFYKVHVTKSCSSISGDIQMATCCVVMLRVRGDPCMS